MFFPVETLYYPQLILHLSVHMSKCQSICTTILGFKGKLMAMRLAACGRIVISGQETLLSMPDRSLQMTIQLVSSGHNWHLPCPSRCLRAAYGSVLEPSSPSHGRVRWSRPSSLLNLHQGGYFLSPILPLSPNELWSWWRDPETCHPLKGTWAIPIFSPLQV